MGVATLNSTVFASIAVAVTSAQAAAIAPDASGLFSASTVYTTSSAVTGTPSCQVAPSRIVNVQVLPLASVVHDEARSGSYVLPGPRRTRPLKIRPTRVRSDRLRATSGHDRGGGARQRLPGR